MSEQAPSAARSPSRMRDAWYVFANDFNFRSYGTMQSNRGEDYPGLTPEALVEFLGELGVFGVDFPPDPAAVADRIVEISDHKDQVRIGPFSDKISPWSKIADLYLQEYERCIERRRKPPPDC